MPAQAKALEAIDILRGSANLKPRKHEVELNDGTIFVFWSAPLTMSEREIANKEAKSDDVNAFALRLLINKALNEDGTKMFQPGHLAVLKRECRDDDVQKLMLAVLTSEETDDDSKSA